MIRRPPRSTQSRSSAASDVYKRQIDLHQVVILKNGDTVLSTIAADEHLFSCLFQSHLTPSSTYTAGLCFPSSIGETSLPPLFTKSPSRCTSASRHDSSGTPTESASTLNTSEGLTVPRVPSSSTMNNSTPEPLAPILASRAVSYTHLTLPTIYSV